MFKNINPQAIQICKTLQDNGYQSYIVGGCVRDLILKIVPKDWDVTTNATPEQVIKLFKKTYLTGLQHGTISVSLNDELFEVTTFRTEGQYLDGRRPETVQFVNNIEEDLSRRDFTINAMAYDPINNKLVDPFNGAQDLASAIIKAVGSPLDRFTEDGLRIMRAARFAARFGFEIEDKTLYSMAYPKALETLAKVSKERVKDELFKILNSPNMMKGLWTLYETEVFSYISNAFFHDLYMKSNLRDLEEMSLAVEAETKLAVLFYPLHGKDLEKSLHELTCSNQEINKILYLTDHLQEVLDGFDDDIFKCNLDYKFIAKLKNNAITENSFEQFLLFVSQNCFIPDVYEKYQNRKIWLKKELAITGNDLLELGMKPGPEFKELLDEAYEEILERPENNKKEFLLGFVKNKTAM